MKLKTITLELPPVGVKILEKHDPARAAVPRFKGVSYCQAVLRATFGHEVVVEPSSITTCQWVPVVLGFKERENEFEKSINTGLPAGTAGVYLAPLDKFTDGDRPDVVIIRATEDTYRKIIGILGPGAFIDYGRYQRDETALKDLMEGHRGGFSEWAIKYVNRWLHWMNRFIWWQKVTAFLFKSTVITRLFDRFITKYMANMSMCRNSTVIPFSTGKANISYFCTGGIAWGKNLPAFMTSGFPYGIYKKLEEHLDYPSLDENGPGYASLMKLRSKMLRNTTVARDCAG